MSVGLAHLRALVAVVEHGSFSGAADHLGVSQSAISHAIAALERATGRAVLTRTGAPRPTALGAQVLDHARAAVAAVAAVDQLAAHRSGPPGGQVVLAAPPTVCHALAPALLATWALELPEVSVSILEGEDGEVAAWLEGAGADLAILTDPAPTPPGALTLGADVFHALLAADHPLADQREIDLADLAEDDFLLSTGGCESAIRQLHTRAQLPLRPRHRVRQLATVLAMVRTGTGISVVPGLAATMLTPGVVMVPLAQHLERTLVLTGPTHRPCHPAVTAMINSAARTEHTTTVLAPVRD